MTLPLARSELQLNNNSRAKLKERVMAKNSSGAGKSGAGSSSSGKGSVSGGRPGTGFPGGNWPSTTGNPSGPGRGNAPGRSK